MSRIRRAPPTAGFHPSEEWMYIFNEVSTACLHSIQRLADPSVGLEHALSCEHCGVRGRACGEDSMVLSEPRPCGCRAHRWTCARCGRGEARIHDPCI